jgi:hypothetical protein
MSEEKPTSGVPRAEFYGVVALLFLFPAILVMASVGFPAEGLLRQVAVGLLYLAAVGMSLTYSVLAMRERARRPQDKDSPPGGPQPPRE